MQKKIPILNLTETYDRFYQNAFIHYESLDHLASFFGRSMHVHRHDYFYQLHIILEGQVHLNLGNHEYLEEAPLIFYTPPPVPHGFVTENATSGHVLTIHQSIIEQLLKSFNPEDIDFYSKPICIRKKDIPEHLQSSYHSIIETFNGLQQEILTPSQFAHNIILQNLTSLILIHLFRINGTTNHLTPIKNTQSEIFRKYLSLIEAHHAEHLSIDDYAQLLSITEGQLNRACRSIANTSSMQLIHERIILEAKYLLSYTNQSIKQIGFQLGYQDPAYFTRFFIKQTQVTPSQYRKSFQVSQ